MPLQATWRVRIGDCDGERDGEVGLARELTGTVSLGGGRESCAGKWLRALAAVVQREAGF